jgi:L-ascorbate metabolism protein UlaG (beta-lactamase superfamily)
VRTVTTGVAIRWLGHSTVVLDLPAPAGTVRLMTDPLLHRHAGLLRRRGDRPEPEGWEGADAALLSHLHHDHAELRSLRLLGDVPVLTAPANARWLRAKGLRGVGLGDAWYEVVPGVDVRLTPAVHGHRPMPHRPNAASGHLVRSRSGDRVLTVWAVGDTERFGGIARVRELAGGHVDVALVPVHGWGPRLSRGHLGPVQAAQVCAEVGVRLAVPVHWGTLHAPGARHLPPGWMDHAGARFESAAHRRAPGTRVVVLGPGESFTVDGDGGTEVARHGDGRG